MVPGSEILIKNVGINLYQGRHPSCMQWLWVQILLY